MPLALPGGWISTPAPKSLNLLAKWEAVKNARLPQNLRAFNSDEAHAIAWQLINYRREAGNADHWQTPQETLIRKAGDCEDWCLFVRALLINGGIVSKKLWLLIVFDQITSEHHALLWTPVRYCDVRASKPLKHNGFVDYRPIAGFSDDEAVTFGRKVSA